MSHIGKKIIIVPENVLIKINKNNIKIIGKFGSLTKKIDNNLIINYKNNIINIYKHNNMINTIKLFGLTRTLIQNMIIGVNEKFSKKLILEGIGYKFYLNNKILDLYIGFSYIVKINIPFYIDIILNSPTKLSLSSISKEKLGLFAAKIRNIKIPEPYKGKGILYENEKIIRKIGKKGK
jgi:large subunit ribosomal protein L6